MSAYESVIGLEVHVELSTRSKMFCGCPTTFGGEPNTQTCPVCLGEPGSLPVPNEKAIEHLMLIGLALDCTVAPYSLFHRKNYFYPDMPKNYQISQYDKPLCINGHLDVEVDGSRTRVGITRAHMEEDTGKSLHVGASGRIADAKYSLIDYNRAGIPLVEIVSEPDIRSASEAQRYLTELRQILQTLGVSDVRMEEGSLRCDANVSLRAPGGEFGTRVEVKNLNSIRSVARAVTYEIERQEKTLNGGDRVVQETRHFDENTGKTNTLRSKEEAFDYRYFPEPDLVPIEADDAWIGRVRATLPELPRARRARIASEHGLTHEQATFVAASPASVRYFEGLLAGGAGARDASVWMAGELARALNESGETLDETVRVAPEDLAALIKAVRDSDVSLNSAKKAFLDAYAERRTPLDIVQEKGLKQVSDDDAIAAIVDEVLAANAGEVERFKAGEEKVFKFLVGQVMKVSKGQASPQAVDRVLRARLGS